MTGSVLDFAAEIGYQLQIAGGEIYRVEESVRRILAAYGVDSGEVFAIPNCLIVSLATPGGEPQTRVRRVPGHGTDIYRLEAVNQLCRSLCEKPEPLEDAWALLEQLVAEEPRYPWWTVLAAHFLGAGMFALFFKGSWTDGLCAGVCGVAVGQTLRGMERLKAGLFIKTAVAAAVAALLALVLCRVGVGDSMDLIIIGTMMILVPGVALTNAVRDVMVGDMVSGISKLGEALLIGVAIALGAAVALRLGGVG